MILSKRLYLMALLIINSISMIHPEDKIQTAQDDRRIIAGKSFGQHMKYAWRKFRHTYGNFDKQDREYAQSKSVATHVINAFKSVWYRFHDKYFSKQNLKNEKVNTDNHQESHKKQRDLRLAIMTGNLPALKKAINTGANVNFLYADEQTPLLLAAKKKNRAINADEIEKYNAIYNELLKAALSIPAVQLAQ